MIKLKENINGRKVKIIVKKVKKTSHVAVVKNINNVVENNSQSQVI